MHSTRLFNGAQVVAGAGLVALALTRGSLSIALAAMFVGGLGMAVTGLYYTVTGEFAGSEPSTVQYWLVVTSGVLVAVGVLLSVGT